MDELWADQANVVIEEASQALEKGKTAMAMLTMRRALTLHPSEMRFHHLLGRIYERMGKPELAKREFSAVQVLSMAPSQATEPVPSLAETAPSMPEFPAKSEAVAINSPPPSASPLTEEPHGTDLTGAPRWTGGQQRAILDSVAHLLSQIAETEQLLKDEGQTDSETFGVLGSARRALSDQVHHARAAWRSEQQQVPAGAAPAQGPVAPAYAAIPAFSRTLGTIQGAVSTGSEIASLQELLNLEGWHVPISGHYDTNTCLAVRKLQEKHHLRKQDAIVNRETRELLNRLTGHVH